MTAFAYNNSVHASTQKTPNELLSNYIATLDSGSENKPLKKNTSRSETSEMIATNKKKLDEFVKKRC